MFSKQFSTKAPSSIQFLLSVIFLGWFAAIQEATGAQPIT